MTPKNYGDLVRAIFQDTEDLISDLTQEDEDYAEVLAHLDEAVDALLSANHELANMDS